MLTLNVKFFVVSDTNTFHENFCCKYFLFFHQLLFHANKVKFNDFLKNLYISDPQSLLLVLSKYCTSANNSFVSIIDKISLKFYQSLRFFLAVFTEKLKRKSVIWTIWKAEKSKRHIYRKRNNYGLVQHNNIIYFSQQTECRENFKNIYIIPYFICTTTLVYLFSTSYLWKCWYHLMGFWKNL